MTAWKLVGKIHFAPTKVHSPIGHTISLSEMADLPSDYKIPPSKYPIKESLKTFYKLITSEKYIAVDAILRLVEVQNLPVAQLVGYFNLAWPIRMHLECWGKFVRNCEWRKPIVPIKFK